MVIEHPSVERARKGYEALAAGDMDTVSGVFADDMVWHVPGGNLLSGTTGARLRCSGSGP
jgi:ketosteroid isomerase-like protein